MPQRLAVGDRVFAGTINLGAPLRLRVRSVGEGTLLAEIVRLMELAEQRRSRFVAIADRVARAYAPVVHSLALLTFLGWTLTGAAPWQTALLYAIAVLIITCPCALGLAVPAVQVLASGRLMRQGTLLKSATALERFARADMVVFDKTGTLTDGPPRAGARNWTRAPTAGGRRHGQASRAIRSHGLWRRRRRMRRRNMVSRRCPGCGLRVARPDGEWRLGRRDWAAGVAEDDADRRRAVAGASRQRARPVRRSPTGCGTDAVEVVGELQRRGYRVALLSGDREPTVRRIAA